MGMKHQQALLDDKLKIQQQEVIQLNLKEDRQDKTLLRYKVACKMSDFIDKKWTCAEYRAMKPFYDGAKANPSMPTKKLLQSFEESWSTFMNDELQGTQLEGVTLDLDSSHINKT